MNKTEIIIEIAQAHDGSVGILHSYIDAIASTGADTLKFQMHIAEAESSMHEPFRVKFSYVDKTRYDYWNRMTFTKEQWREIKDHTEQAGLEFLCSPFSLAAVECLEELGVKRYKIASGEVSNYLMLQKIAQTGKPVILSSGMSSYAELDETIEFLKPFGNQLGLMQCTTAYPTPPRETGLNVIREMRERYGLPVGLSDHSGTIYPAIAAVALGAQYIEVHAVFHKSMFGPDTKASLTIEDITRLVEGIRFIEEAREAIVDKNDNEKYAGLKEMFGKSLAVNKDLPEGHILTLGDLESKKPAKIGIAADQYEKVIGKKLIRTKRKYDFITPGDIQ